MPCSVLGENVPGSGLIWCFGDIVFRSWKKWKGLYTFLAVLWLKELQSNLSIYPWIKVCESISWVFKLYSLFWIGHLHWPILELGEGGTMHSTTIGFWIFIKSSFQMALEGNAHLLPTFFCRYHFPYVKEAFPVNCLIPF